MSKYENILDFTGQESGVIVYGDDVVICNWSSFALNGLPRLFVDRGELVAFGELMTADYLGDCADIGSELVGKDLVYDLNDDFDGLHGWSGAKYAVSVDDVQVAVVYAPNEWA